MTIKSKQMISLIIHFLLLSEVVPRKKVLNGQKILSSVSTTLAYYFGFFPALYCGTKGEKKSALL